MSAVIFRPDYAKFIFELPRGIFAMNYRHMCELSHLRKYHGDFLRSHHVQALPCMNPDFETTVLELWGEWAGLVELFPPIWIQSLQRYDVRATLWDTSEEAIIATGQHLQKTVTSYNINVYSTRPASKRRGRSRGGKGYAIGSHKSEIRVTCYKRTGEPSAVEFQIQGPKLKKAAKALYQELGSHSGTIDIWKGLTRICQQIGDERLTKVFGLAGIGNYWPVINSSDVMVPEETQRAFAAPTAPKDEEDHYMWYLQHYGDPSEAV